MIDIAEVGDQMEADAATLEQWLLTGVSTNMDPDTRIAAVATVAHVRNLSADLKKWMVFVETVGTAFEAAANILEAD